jgi:hypothetical protein
MSIAAVTLGSLIATSTANRSSALSDTCTEASSNQATSMPILLTFELKQAHGCRRKLLSIKRCLEQQRLQTPVTAAKKYATLLLYRYAECALIFYKLCDYNALLNYT